MLDLNANELEILDYWKKNDIVGQIRARNRGKKKFYFLDGPPYVSGNLHPGQMWVKAIKDISLRYRRMRGFDVRDIPGYDVHGLPIENKVEKALGLKSKQEIENKVGVEEFIKQCKAFVVEGIGAMDKDYERFGITLDFKHPYIPYNSPYIEAGWSIFKRISDNGLLYKDTKATLYCPRCQTPVSQGTVEAEYSNDNDPSILVPFKVIKNDSKAKIAEEDGSYYLLIWTTTPWTLPSNVSVAVNPKELYVLAKFDNRKLIVAKKRLEAVSAMLDQSAIAICEFFGSEMEGMQYANPLEELVPKQKELRKYHIVQLAEDLVTMEDGTGLVHIAPGHGIKDYNLGKRLGLPIFSPISANAEYTADAGKYEHIKVPDDANKAVLSDLKALGALLFNGSITHSYPHCWRCDSKLIFMATPQWFFNIQKVKKKILSENSKVVWHPEEAGAWQADVISNSPDWCVSRQRYWGIPLPIWECDKCKHISVVGSLEELKSIAVNKREVEKLTDLHRPYIDAIEAKCSECGGAMHRVKDVADVWLDSSIAFKASIGSEDDFKRLFPIDYIIEGKDQLRGWFSGLIKISVLAYGVKPFKHVGVDGMMLAEDGREMHKKLGNYVPIDELLKMTSADAFRLWSTSHTPWLDLLFSPRELREAERTINVLYNSANLVEEYGKLIKVAPKWGFSPRIAQMDPEEKWIFSRLQSLIESVTNSLDNYESHNAINAIKYFINEDFSRFYLKIAKKKLLSGDKRTQNYVMQTISNVLNTVLILSFPIIPFTSEYISLRLLHSTDTSVFMSEWPKAKDTLMDKELEGDFEIVKAAISTILNSREQEHVPLRWPIKSAIIEVNDNRVYNTLLKYSSTITDYTNSKSLEVKNVVDVGIEVKPQFQKIGPEFKDMAGFVAEAIKSADTKEIKKAIETNGVYPLHTSKGVFEIKPEHVMILEFSNNDSMKKFEYGYAAINAEKSEELEYEAFIRELERRVQLERKNLGLKRSDKIEIFIESNAQTDNIISSYMKQLRQDLNASEITLTQEFDENMPLVPLEILDTNIRIAIKTLQQKQ